MTDPSAKMFVEAFVKNCNLSYALDGLEEFPEEAERTAALAVALSRRMFFTNMQDFVTTAISGDYALLDLVTNCSPKHENYKKAALAYLRDRLLSIPILEHRLKG